MEMKERIGKFCCQKISPVEPLRKILKRLKNLEKQVSSWLMLFKSDNKPSKKWLHRGSKF